MFLSLGVGSVATPLVSARRGYRRWAAPKKGLWEEVCSMARLSTAGRMLGLARIVALGARVRSFLRQEVKSCRANHLYFIVIFPLMFGWNWQ